MNANPIEHTYTDVALLVVRILLGFELLWHGLPKLIDPAAAGEKFVGMGFPGMLAPVIGALEVGAAALILVGYLTPMAIIVAFAIITVALVAVQLPKGGVHAALERDALILTAMVVLLAFGPGRLSIENKIPQPTFLSRKTEG